MNSRNYNKHSNKRYGFKKKFSKTQNKNIFIENLNNYLSSYMKKANNSNDIYTFEIQFGKEEINKQVYKNSINKDIYDKLINKINKDNQYSYKKQFNYIIYGHRDISLYINQGSTGGEFQCLKSNGFEHSILKSNKDKAFDLKIGLVCKKKILLNDFEPRYSYHSEINRNTTSFNFSNLFYINFSTIYSLKESGISPIYQICITLPRKIKKDKSYIFKELRKYVQIIQQTIFPFDIKYSN